MISSTIIVLVNAQVSWVVWSQTYGGTNDDQAHSLVATSDGGYALGGYTNSFGAGLYDFWLIKTDATGNVELNQTYGGTKSDIPYSLVETSDGGFVLAGSTRSFGHGNEDFWLVKTDESGNMEWNRFYGGADHEIAYSLVENSDSGFTLAGYKLNFELNDYDFWLVRTNEQGIPEFPSWVILPLLLVATLAAIICKQRLPKTSSINN